MREAFSVGRISSLETAELLSSYKKGAFARARLLSLAQKFNFNPNCITRFGSPIAMTVAELGNEAVLQQTWPKVLL